VGRGAHGRFAAESGIDYNLAGAPLLVVEGAAQLRSAAEVRAYAASLAAVLHDAGAWAGTLGDGTLTFVLHAALRKRGDLKPGAACEVRHLSALDDVEQAAEAECARQAALRDSGADVERRVLLWDAAAGHASPARTPSVAAWHLADPDLPPLVLTAEWVEARRGELPELAPARRERLRRMYGLQGLALETVTADLSFAEYYETVARLHGDGPGAARWIETHVLPLMTREGLTTRDIAVRVRPADLARVLDQHRDGRLSDDAADRVFRAMVRTGLSPERAAEREGFVLTPAPE
jgi:aspartyl-tRNA(Asn)/glutamyl-tRNA(Gln) amidotransferase subunit B